MIDHTNKNSTVISTVLFASWRLLPAKGLAQDPERYRNGDKKQAKTNWAAPAEPRTPRTPVFQAVLVTIVVVLLVVLEAFALLLHSVPFVN